MQSREFQALVKSISEIRIGLIDFPPSPTEPYATGSLLKCQAFVVFSHAEMQSYWEAVARRILREAVDRWTMSETADRAIATLVAFRRPEKVSVPDNPLLPHDGGSFAKIVSNCANKQSEIIGHNNGIKRANIAELLMPLGILPNDFPEALLIQLDQTGQKRGDMVHKSSKVSLRTVRDPFVDEIKDIDGLVAEIGSFDRKLGALGLLSG